MVGNTVAVCSVEERDAAANHEVEDLLQLRVLAGIVAPQELVAPAKRSQNRWGFNRARYALRSSAHLQQQALRILR